jgi:hypothetical protein
MPTSISDTHRYRAFCKLAAENDLVFEAFRRHPAYSLVDGLGVASGQEYIDIAYLASPTLSKEYIEEFRKSDNVGAPIKYNLKNLGVFSPATLRYIKVAIEMSEMFGSLNGMRIAEIGGGYGGQCRALSVINKHIASYAIYDLPEPMALAKRFLSHFDTPRMSFLDVFDTEAAEYDLVISNYAFGEIEKTVQDVYLDKVINNSQRGYMIYNAEAFAEGLPGFTYSSNEITEKIRGANITPIGKMPFADQIYKNTLIYWGASEEEPKPIDRPGVDIARGKPAIQSSLSHWSRPGDAQGAVNGAPNGSYGFHTGLDQHPWWQVDLESDMALDEVIVFNRLDAGRSRAYSFVLKLASEDGVFREVHAQGGIPFGGIDGRPARIKLDGAIARYVRIELPHEGYLHLDEVEVYGHSAS